MTPTEHADRQAAREGKKMERQPIETAPKDGTTIWLTNKVMKGWVRGRWGDFHSPWRDKPYLCWVTEYTPEYDDMGGFPAGKMCCPDEWAPYVEDRGPPE